uniref:Progestin and adipoQ receptor family member Va n=1 Tax=Cyprinus carpio TaxID=7962 RepID=A0A8C2KZT2_CYPCA
KDCVFSLFQNRFFCKVFLMETADGRITFTWPFLVFLLSCCVYPLASSCAHTFSTMSERARHICFFFDYGALSFYSLDKWINCTFHTYYVPIADVNCKLFKIFVCNGEGCTVNEASTVHHQHIWLSSLAHFLPHTCLNAWLLANHQLFHVFGITGTHFQMTAIDLDMAAPKQWLHAHLLPVTLSNTAGAAFFSVVSGLCIVYCMSSLADWSHLKNQFLTQWRERLNFEFCLRTRRQRRRGIK